MLKDVLDRVAVQLPRYFAQLGAVLARPVSEVSRRAQADGSLDEALIFWSISLVFYLTSRYVAYHTDADQVVYFAGNLLASCVMLVVVATAFWSVWHLFGAGASLASHVAATALVWGALMPIEAVLHAIAIGATRMISDEVYDWLRESAAGCFDRNTFGILEMMERAFQSGGTALLGFGLYSVIVLSSVIISFVYFVAYLRILRQFRPLSSARFVLVSALSSATALVAGAIGASFYLALAQGIVGCR